MNKFKASDQKMTTWKIYIYMYKTLSDSKTFKIKTNFLIRKLIEYTHSIQQLIKKCFTSTKHVYKKHSVFAYFIYLFLSL